MAEKPTCPECGAELLPNAPEGLCPSCLLRPDVLAADTQAMPQTPAAESERIRYFGDYELIEEIARGGMGVVYLARQVTLNRHVAVKMILAGHLANETAIKRFYAEAEAAANLKHPNIVSIHEVGSHDGQHYFSMDFIEGDNLSERVRGRPQAASDAAAVVKTIAEAIHYAHQRGVLHRDLKPSNVLIDKNGRPHVTDFGLAKLFHRDDMLTQSGDFMGTPSYMPPEQASGRLDQLGPPSDVYALGAILYELLTGRPPFQSSSSVDTLLQVINVEPLSPKRINANVPSDLETICLKCLEKSPRQRYHSAGELAGDLERFLNHEPIHARPAGVLRKMVVWIWRRPGQLAATAALVFCGLVGGLYYLVQESAFLRAKQGTPGLLREPGPRVEALENWSSLATLVFFASIVSSHWFTKRMHEKTRRSSDDGLTVQPSYLVGGQVRTLAACIGVLATLFTLAFVMKLIAAHVWERGGSFSDVAMSYGTAWWGLWLLVNVAANYRRSLFGAPQRRLTSKQNVEMERVLLEGEVREAIRFYHEAFADADGAEARAFVVQRLDDLRRQRPREFAAHAPKLRDLNWRNMAICALIEAPIVAALWLLLRPASIPTIQVGCGFGAAFVFGVNGAGRLVGARNRLLANLPLAAMLIIAAGSYNAGILDMSGPSLYLGMICGVPLMFSCYTPKHGHRPNSP